MLRKWFCAAALVLCLLAATIAPAFALPNGVRATPNQKLAFRTGPNTAFTELYTLPQSTPIVAIELEEGNDVLWVLCEFQYEGQRVRAYTGLKRFELSAGSLPYANHAWLTRRLTGAATVYAAPDFLSETRATLSAGTAVSFLGFEGSFCFIEYQKGGERERGYVREEDFMLDLGEFAEAFPDNPGDTLYAVRTPANFYAAPNASSPVLFSVPYDGCVAIDFDDSYSGDWWGASYGGLAGFVHMGEFNDLRGFDEDWFIN